MLSHIICDFLFFSGVLDHPFMTNTSLKTSDIQQYSQTKHVSSKFCSDFQKHMFIVNHIQVVSYVHYFQLNSGHKITVLSTIFVGKCSLQVGVDFLGSKQYFSQL